MQRVRATNGTGGSKPADAAPLTSPAAKSPATAAMNGGARGLLLRNPAPALATAGRGSSVRSTHIAGGHVLGAESVGQGTVTSIGALQQQREVLRRLQEFQGRSQADWEALMKCKALWETEKSFLQKQLTEWESKYEALAIQLAARKQQHARLTQQLHNAHFKLRTSGSTVSGSYTKVDWSAFKWSTSKLLSKGSTYLSIYGWLHCVFTISIFISLIYVVGTVSRSTRFPILLEWSLFSDNIGERVWPITVANALHVHVPILIILALGLEFLILYRRGSVSKRSMYMCIGSSFSFYWVMYAWMWFQEDQPLAAQGYPAAVEGEIGAVLSATRTAQSGVVIMFSGVLRGVSIHHQLLTTPTLWLVLLLPPPAFLAVRVLKFPKLARPASEGIGQRLLSRFTAVLLWFANAMLIAVTTVLTCHILAALSSRPAMLALLNWHQLPEGLALEFPVHWALYTRAALFYYLPVCMTVGVFVLRLALLLAQREHPAAFMQHLAIDVVFLGVLVAWVRVVLGIPIQLVDGCTTPTLVCAAVCLGRMLVAFHFNFWRESEGMGDEDEELDDVHDFNTAADRQPFSRASFMSG